MKPSFHIFRPRPDIQGPFHEAMLQARARFPSQAVRVPHHTCSREALVGTMRSTTDGALLQVVPGECLLADGGVLILDELPEFKRIAIERVAAIFKHQVSRLAAPRTDVVIDIPARFTIYATAMRCPCGLLPTNGKPLCRCSAEAIKRFNDRAHSFETLLREATK